MMRVLHVTEAMGSGVLSVVDSISRRQAEAGAEVRVLFVPRPETPSDEALRARFHPGVELTRVSTGGRVGDLIALRRVLRGGDDADVIHAHSSFAGAIVRHAVRRRRDPRTVYYSPHGFAFLRLDLPPAARVALRAVERHLARHSTLILTSPSEFAVAQSALAPPRAHLLQTGVTSETVARRPRRSDPGRRPVVGMVGRVTYQKAPWRFAAAARALDDRADFVWIGGGTADDETRWFADAPVRVTGWVSPAELAALIDDLDVLLFPSLWEGMSLSLIQAQAQGLPAVVSDVVGNRDTVDDGVTGFVRGTDDELVAATARLLGDAGLRERMSAAALTWARRALTDDRVGQDSLALYATALAPREGSTR
ncbi:glycosyltransferase family 4 protein [Microbacterium sp. VKM Ac-2923]|uniref:glycosyltransferase family 4 protein n=1 Tax=Microbacterium sp. VKM Ac-2923 TaxID=2929476 RepID=UPI001FB3D184|nr:glycosyltransferase family 4 protein [Microbacterium sp. VKM Ac-2923]MCJ1707877.1 glycosyltransferase family 4 protein [Microbacterium sp. VKM Ac-2923]